MSRQLKTCRSECIATTGEWVGYVTNQPGGYQSGHPHMSQAICARPECLKRALREVREFTGEDAHFCEFGSATA